MMIQSDHLQQELRYNIIMKEDKKFVITINDYDGRYSDRSTTRIVDKDQLHSILAKTAPNKILALHELGPSIALKTLEL